MYENVTYEDILQRMLDRIPETMDKREGSIIYDALAPAAVELQLMYIEFDVILSETFADTASRDYLIKRCAERGITPTPATNAILKGVFTPSTLAIEEGARFSCGTLNYTVTDKIEDGVYKLQCETEGEEGNAQFGQLIPIQYIDGLETCELAELLIPGEDEEDTEALRTRYFDSFDTIAFGGNQKDYVQKTDAISGVGGTKVDACWNGGGTVKLTIIGSDFNKASDTLVQVVQQTIDPTNDSTGQGIAPIGHVVTVEAATETTANISTEITFKEGYSWSGQKAKIVELIEAYFLELREAWETESYSIVRISQIESRIMTLESVLDVTGTKINGVAENLILDAHSIPILGGVENG